MKEDGEVCARASGPNYYSDANSNHIIGSRQAKRRAHRWDRAFGLAMIVCGLVYRTPMPVQPMKAAGAIRAWLTDTR
jgi:hypothetical protein